MKRYEGKKVVIIGRGGPRFPPESFERLRMFRPSVRQKLQRYVAAQADVFSLIDSPRTPASKAFQYPVAGRDQT